MARLNSASAPSKSPASNSLMPRLRWSIAARRLTCAQSVTTFSRKQKSRNGSERRRMGCRVTGQPVIDGVQSTDFSRVFIKQERAQLKLVLYTPLSSETTLFRSQLAQLARDLRGHASIILQQSDVCPQGCAF